MIEGFDLSVIVGVSSEPLEDGTLFIGPKRKTAWAANGELSAALAHVTSHRVAAHPWEPWPNQVPRKKKRKKTKPDAARQARERSLHV